MTYDPDAYVPLGATVLYDRLEDAVAAFYAAKEGER